MGINYREVRESLREDAGLSDAKAQEYEYRAHSIEVSISDFTFVMGVNLLHGDPALRHEMLHCLQVAEFAYDFVNAAGSNDKSAEYFGLDRATAEKKHAVSIAGFAHDIQNSLSVEGTFELVPKERMWKLIPESEGQPQWRMDDFDNMRMLDIVKRGLERTGYDSFIYEERHTELFKILELGMQKLKPKQVMELQKAGELYRVAHKVGDGVAFGMGNIQRMCEAIYMADIVQLYVDGEATLTETTAAIDDFHNKYLTQYDSALVDGKMPVQLPFDQPRAEKILAKKNFPFKMDDLREEHEAVFALIHDGFTSNRCDEENRQSVWYDQGYVGAVEALRQAKTHDKVKDVSAITDRLDKALEVVQKYAQRQYRLEGKTL